MSVELHKTEANTSSTSEKTNHNLEENNNDNTIGLKDTQQATNLPPVPVFDIEKENRLTKIITLYSKGLTQAEIAKELGITKYIILNKSTNNKTLR